MGSEFKSDNSYKSILISLSILTVIFAFCGMLLGYVFLPFAAAYYAMLIWHERSDKRILTYIIPPAIFIINFFINGIFSLEGIAYAVLGAVIYFSYKNKKSKGETAFWSVLLIVAFIAISLIFLAFNSIGKANIAAITEFYSSLTELYREKFIEMATSITREDKNTGLIFFAYNSYQAGQLFDEMLIMLIPIAVIAAFLLAGITLKIFCHGMKKRTGDVRGINSWNFKTTSLIAYFYLIISVIALFTYSQSGAFPLIITTLNSIFGMVYAYVGFTFIYDIIAHAKGPIFALTVMFFSLMFLSSFAVQLLSYIGVYYTVITNKMINFVKK